MTTPTPRQAEVVAAFERLGKVEAVAKDLGVSRITVEVTLAQYHRRVCTPHIADLERELSKLRGGGGIEHATHRLELVVGRIERAVTPVSHRRIADGGKHVRQQRQEIRKATS